MAKAKVEQQKQKIRQPIVAVMGHVDHGKTTFLDSIRNSNVADKEHGGITQNTRAHEVTTKSGFKITFIDTPGHEAFANMRSRGARVTDFVLLMVAADDGVQPQTKQSIEFAHENKVPIIVCINKVDIEGVQLTKIKQELAGYGVNIEEYGGDSMCFEISAKNKIGLEAVLEGIELLAEVNNLSSRLPKEGVVAEAFVMESQLDQRMGHSALAILKAGNLNKRMIGVTARSIFKVRAYQNELGKTVDKVDEAQPFTIIGLDKDIPTGEIINFVETDKIAKELQEKLNEGLIVEDVVEPVAEVPNVGDLSGAESLFAQLLMQKEIKNQGAEQKELKVVVRSSTQGTLEAVLAELNKLETSESRVTVLQSGTGFVSEDDLTRAKVAKGIVLSFQSNVPSNIKALARRNKVLVREYQIIYELIDEVTEVLDSMDQPQQEEVEFAKAKVKQVFTLSDGAQVAGCEVIENKFLKGYQVKIMRKDVEITRSKITSVRIGKNEAKEAKKGQDCGFLLDPKVDELEEGDIIVAFRIEKY